MQFWFQCNQNYLTPEILSHPFFKRINVHPIVWVNIHDLSTDPVEGALVTVQEIIKWKKRLNSIGRVTFKYALTPAGWGYTTKLHNHENDLILGKSSVNRSTGIKNTENYAYKYVCYLKRFLKEISLPDPIFIDSDNEKNPDLITDGDLTQNYNEFKKFSPIDRMLNALNIKDTMPVMYNTEDPKSGNIYSIIDYYIREMSMYETLYKPFKCVFPNTLCQNWNNFSSTIEYPTFIYRPKESPVLINDLNFTMFGDRQVWPCYGINNFDHQDFLTNYSGYANVRGFRELFTKLNIGLSVNPGITELYLKNIEYHIKAMKIASSKPINIWYQTIDQETPIGNLIFDRVLVRDSIKLMKGLGIQDIGIFEPSIIPTNLDMYHWALSRLY